VCGRAVDAVGAPAFDVVDGSRYAKHAEITGGRHMDRAAHQ
jgi:hypothetical protein